MNTQFLVDTAGRKTAVVLSIDDFRALIERLEELEDLRLIEERKSESRIDTPSLEALLARVEAEN
jgi:PHD/YefM family antitoxin component YafN of YafNO toxin-antitoxin module